MRRVKKRKKNKILIFIVAILLFVCAGVAISSLHKAGNISPENSSETTMETIETPSTTEPVQELRGTVKDATMNTLTVQGEDNHEYYFGTDGVNISTGKTGIVIGNPVTVLYHGELDSNVSVQEVELLSITVTDANPNTPPATARNSKCNDTGRKSRTDVYCTLPWNKWCPEGRGI